MKKLLVLFAASLQLLPLGAEMATPETSRLFEKTIDPESMAVSYRLKKNSIAPCQQGTYFVNKSMTDDGRFLLFIMADNEWKTKTPKRSYALIDFEKDEVFEIPFYSMGIPLVDIKNDVIYYANKGGIFKRELLVDPQKEVKICPLPEDYLAEGELKMIYTHLTLSHDGTKAFFESRFTGPHWVQGVVDLTTGKWEKWGEEDNYPINHGQINPVRDDIALCAHETSWTTKTGEKVRIQNWDGVYPRLQLIEKGKRTMVPPANNYATHERWDEQGEGFYWCSNGVWYCDLETMKQDLVSPYGDHAMMSIDRNNVVSDDRIGPFYRGAYWRVWFWNRKLSEGLYLAYSMPAIGTPKNPSTLHPDPHPHFVCKDKYIVWTEMDPDRTMNLMVTPVAGLNNLLESKLLGDLPYDQSAEITWRKLYRRIDMSEPSDVFWQATMNLLHRIGEKDMDGAFGNKYYHSFRDNEACSIIALETFLNKNARERTNDQWLNARVFGLSCAEKGKPEVKSLYEKALLQIEAWRVSQRKEFLDKALELASGKIRKGEEAQRLAVSAMTMRYLAPSDPRFVALNNRYLKEAASLASSQGADGLWNSDPDESALYTYALAEGLLHGWLDKVEYTEILRKAWAKLCSAATTDEIGNAALMNLCNMLI